MSNTINFGIDLGTTNSAIAKYNEGDVEVFRNPLNLKQTLPSVIAFRKKRIIIGDKAKEVVKKDPDNVIGGFKRKMGTSDKYLFPALQDTMSPINLSALVLKELKNFIHTGESLQSVVITIPAAFDTMQSNATKKAGYEAGFQQVVLLQEPIAASLAYANKAGVDLSNGKWLVYDLGGGTFDVALVSIEDDEMRVIDHEGDNYLGGSDFDRAIIEQLIVPYLEKEGNFENLEQEMKSASGKYNRLYNALLYKAEEAKIQLSHAQEVEIEIETEDDDEEEIEVYLPFTKTQLDNILKPYIERTIEMMEAILQRNHMESSDIKFVLMVGGSTYIPSVKEAIARRFGIDINCNIDPTTAVVTGAAYYAGMKPIQLEKVKSQPSSQQVGGLLIKTAYSKVSKDEDTMFLAVIEGKLQGLSYRITRSDGGFDSGLKPLARNISEYLPLVANIYNQFEFKVYDSYNNPVEVQVPTIGVTQGKFNIDGQPLPNDICLEVDAVEDKTTYLEPIFKKNAILPVKKTIIKEVSKTIYKNSDTALVINVLEGDTDSLPAANKMIGSIKISGKDLHRDLIKGSDVELTFEVSESRDLSVEVYLSLTGQEFENVFNPSELQIDIAAIRSELTEFERNLLRKQKDYERTQQYEEAGRLMTLVKEIEELLKRIDSIQSDDITDEKYQIELAKRAVAKKIHQIYNKSMLTKATEEYYKAKGNARQMLIFGNKTPEDEREINAILDSEKSFLPEGNVSIIQMKTKQLRGILQRMNARTKLSETDIIAIYGHYRNLTYQDKTTAQRYFKEGDAALDSNNISTLTYVLNQLYALKKQEDNSDPDMFRKSGTGLR